MSNKNDGKPDTGEKPEAVEETPEPTLDDLFSELKLSDQGKKMLTMIISGVANNIKEISNRLDGLEKQPAAENPDIYAGLSAEQKYQVMMAKASGPAAAAQQGVLQALLARVGGGGSGGGGGDVANLLKSAETIQGLRSVLFPEPSPLQMAMEKAQVAQVLSQTRLMNKVAGKATSDYLDKIEAEIEGTKTEAETEAEVA
ncbi:unnamed protein product [marine sediment metagenome]|uniref:Uncharacterized protein n=1 Tax=marine sediment metagenome TaxID=412755 RepID=X1RLS4_9ZZZZ